MSETKVKCPTPTRRGGCGCPREYSRCRAWVAYDRERGDHSKGHGGWGWGSSKKT